MGAEQSRFNYAVEVTQPEDPSKESGHYRSILNPDVLCDIFENDHTSAWGIFDRSCAVRPNGNWLGYRPLLKPKPSDDDAPQRGEYQWITYSQGRITALKLARAFKNWELCPLQDYDDEYPQARSMRLVGINMTNCPEWYFAEQACMASRVTLVPLYDTLGEEAKIYILQKTRLHTMFVQAATLPGALDVAKVTELRNVIFVGEEAPCELQLARAKENGVRVILFDEISRSTTLTPIVPNPCKDSNDVNTLCYTSGTTGMPKGVIITHRNFLSIIKAFTKEGLNEQYLINSSTVYLSYLPLTHVFERAVANIVIALSAQIACYSGDLLKLVDDAAVAKPTVFVSVPRLYNRICDKVLDGIEQKSYVVQGIAQYALEAKKEKFRNTGNAKSTTWDLLFSKFRNILGGRVEMMISGGAPLEPQVQETLQAMFSCPIVQGFGLTETLGPCFLQAMDDPISGTIGGVWPCTEFKVVSVPEMGYVANGDVPSGELRLRGSTITPGYFLAPELTAEAFPEGNGWLATGDICRILNENKAVRIVDRRKNLFKLAQGEYVSPEKVENVLSMIPAVNQIFVTGSSSENFPICVVVPDREHLRKWVLNNWSIITQSLGDFRIGETSLKSVPERSSCEVLKAIVDEGCLALISFFLSEISNFSRRHGLKGFEICKAVLLRWEDFNVENGCLTPTSKLRRYEIQDLYAQRMSNAYAKEREIAKTNRN